MLISSCSGTKLFFIKVRYLMSKYGPLESDLMDGENCLYKGKDHKTMHLIQKLWT